MTQPESDGEDGVEGAEPTLLEQMGGVSGLLSSTIPVAVLVPVNSMWGLVPAIAAAVGAAVLVFVWRLARKETLQPAVSGLFAVLIGAAIAFFVGDARGYFLYGIWYSAVAAVAFLVTIIIGRPAVGLIWEGINNGDRGWFRNRKVRQAYQIATGAWAVVFAARFFIQDRLYQAEDVTWLGIARILMGWPLTGIVLIITVWAVRRARAGQSTESENAASAAEGDGESRD
ncbi:DUF3159 domain-containing protein [Corynebacterium sputi]|uniref:DUF3159 domain-containing protein n=1 Tax=Corynebacterium sputi TaxID=489915 RepID=UPI00042644F5|nr:DUF3159 domain-containing protein [Corynebacterium sputi]